MAYTPMLEQYLAVKEQHKEEILFFRLGDFYEMFFDDAKVASRELEITLTGRDGGGGNRIPMCGVPYHAADNYIAKLIAKGYKVAICEQVEDPKAAKGIVRREVTKIITAGTLTQESLLSDLNNNYLAVLYEKDLTLALAAADISTGECFWAAFNSDDRYSACFDFLYRLMPSEIILASSLLEEKQVRAFMQDRLTGCTASSFQAADTTVCPFVTQHFTVEEHPADRTAHEAVEYLLAYLHHTLKNDCSHVNRLTQYELSAHLILDASTLRNLEITRNMKEGGKKGTLLSVLDFTQTAMGGRLLKRWLEYPLVQREKIMERQDAVAEFIEEAALRLELREALQNIYDFERILTRIEVGTANARDLKALGASLAALPDLKNLLARTRSSLLIQIYEQLDLHESLAALLAAAIVDEPPFSVREGAMIRSGYHEELDALRLLAKDNRQWIQDVETREKEVTGIKTLKIGYNKVFGYYIEVSRAQSALVPPTYMRKQTLANAERYITPELKEYESKVLGAQEKIVQIEYELFCEIREQIKAYIPAMQLSARLIAACDTLASFAEAAQRYQYIRPALSKEKQIVIQDGRHPVVERLLRGEMFVPNDTKLNHRDHEMIILTGPNMAGKSTYMRQVALLTLMAQAGSFIPAASAQIYPVDRIFTRVGASDDLATGQSTFMVEMSEVAHILSHATKNSLVILDEIGRGTSTYDGMSIARSVIEFMEEKIQAFTLFATHYHELTRLAEASPRLKNYSIAVKERGKDVIFLRRIIAGGADKSYGIHVAQLAGLPKKLIARAEEILNDIEQCRPEMAFVAEEPPKKIKEAAPVLDLFSQAVIEELLAVDVMSLTPIEALNRLYQLQNQAKEEVGR
ncbi:MAG: DNA mismatch repair protein MutS [Sporomusaceae bacterium]|nr:DNA mismatch repair protein MutS [Sporomusaceae bacterium]